MSRYQRGPKAQFRNPQPPYPCHFNCGRELATKFDRKATEGWEWFCGYGDGPIHFCPQCRRTSQFEIDRIREKLNIKPHNYPQEFAKI